MPNLLLKLNKQDKDVIHCIDRGININNALFLGRINRIDLRSKLFLQLGIVEKIEDNEDRKKYFKEQNYETFKSYYKGVKCYGVKVDDEVYICLCHSLYNEEKRNCQIERIRKDHNKYLKFLLEEYLIEFEEFRKYYKIMMEAERELVTEASDGKMAVYRVKHTNILPKGICLNPKSIILKNVLKIKGYLEDNNILKTMQEYHIGVFDIVENKKYIYIANIVDDDYILK